MGIINSILKERFEAGIEDIFLAGAKPTHVDFVIFAYVPFTIPLSVSPLRLSVVLSSENAN